MATLTPRQFPSRVTTILSVPEEMGCRVIFCPEIWAEVAIKYSFNLIVLRVHPHIYREHIGIPMAVIPKLL